MKLFKYFAAVALGLATLVSCNNTVTPDEDTDVVGKGIIVIGEQSWNNITFLYDPARITDQSIQIHFLFEGQGNETANWIKYVPGDDKDYQMAFQMPDSDYPARGYIKDWKGGITKIDDTHYKVDVSGKYGSDNVNISFKGKAVSK